MRNKGHTQFVRGGQTTQHWARMATQVIRYSISVAAGAFALSYLWLVWQNYELDKVRLTGTYWLAEFNVERRGTEERPLRYIDLSGQAVTRSAGEIYADRDLRAIYIRYAANARRFAWISLIPAAVSFILVFAVFALVGRSLKEEEYIRGARLVTARELKAWSRRKWRDYEKAFGKASKTGPRYTLAGIEFPPNAVEAQTGITGTVGVGKTNAMHELLGTIRTAGGRAIIYDRMGGLLRDHYDPERDVIVNPFDERSVGWTPFAEVTSPQGFAQIAEVMIPDHPGATDTFWTQSARLVFQYAARELARAGKTTNADLRRAIMTIPSADLAQIVAATPGAHFFGEDVARTSASIRANMITELRFLEYLRDDAPPFSIRDWVVNGDDETTRPGFVFLTGNAEQSAATRNIVSTLFEVAANALMVTEESRDPKVWFFLDEVPTLNRMPFLPKSLAEIRQFGGAFVVGYQVFSQLEEIYGPKAAETISGVLNNRVVFNTPDYNTAQRSSRSLGEEDVIEQQENLTLGANESRDGVGLVGRRTQRPIVTPAEIQALPQFMAYFRPAYDAPTARVRFAPVKTQAQWPKFVPYTGPGFDAGGMQLTAINAQAREGAAPETGFAALPAADQKAEFVRWLARIRPGGAAGIEEPGNVSERDWLWQHFATARSRGVEEADVPPPDPYAGFARNRPGAAPETVLLPFPGEEENGADSSHGDVGETTKDHPPAAQNNAPAPISSVQNGKESDEPDAVAKGARPDEHGEPAPSASAQKDKVTEPATQGSSTPAPDAPTLPLSMRAHPAGCPSPAVLNGADAPAIAVAPKDRGTPEQAAEKSDCAPDTPAPDGVNVAAILDGTATSSPDPEATAVPRPARSSRLKRGAAPEARAAVLGRLRAVNADRNEPTVVSRVPAPSPERRS